MRNRRSPGSARFVVAAAIAIGLLAANIGPASSYVNSVTYQHKIDTLVYKQQMGHWAVLNLPSQYRVNAVHAVLLHTGKVLITAGSGNDAASFAAGTFKSLLWDPATNKLQLIPTPSDLFCSIHASLPNGNILIAGGTQRYEILAPDVTKAAGSMIVKDESPHSPVRTYPQGTKFTSPSGIVYLTTSEFTLTPATKVIEPDGSAVVTASQTSVWVEAATKGTTSVSTTATQYGLAGTTGADQRDIYGLSSEITMAKQDFQGTKFSYEFNPYTESYERLPNMNQSRWYPSLATLANGKMLAVSGLDNNGHILTGQNEVFDPQTKTWTQDPSLNRYFPTYPALFLTAGGQLFYSGSNSGYGPLDQGRQPGLWNVTNNTFAAIPGLRDANQTETSGSLLLPPAQKQTFMILGGGGNGESSLSTARTDIVDLTAPDPHFTPGPNLAAPTRYPSSVILPDDTVLVTGGSKDYRGKHGSDNRDAQLYHPTTNAFSSAAAPTIGRDYHSEALLLPDGRVVTMGSNPLYGDKADTTPASFEQRLEIYTPPYLYKGPRPTVEDGPTTVTRDSVDNYTVSDPSSIATARLIRPSAVTHSTDVDQRSIELGLSHHRDGTLGLSIPAQPGLVPSGWYMLFVSNTSGVPSVARWVEVS